MFVAQTKARLVCVAATGASLPELRRSSGSAVSVGRLPDYGDLGPRILLRWISK